MVIGHTRSWATLGATLFVVLLVGCSGTSEPRPSGTGNGQPSPSATASEPTTPTPSASGTDPANEMTGAEAESICYDRYFADFGDKAGELMGLPSVQERSLDPEWLVAWPAQNENGPMTVLCIVGGDPDDPTFLTVGQGPPSSPEDIDRWLVDNTEFMP